MKPSTITKVLPSLIKAQRPVFIWGPSGAGKSSVVHQHCGDNKLEIRDVRLSQLDAIDLRGFPVPDTKAGKTRWLPADFLPTKDDKPGVLFLDEMNGAKPAVGSAAYQLILDRRLGAYKFPDHWAIIAAGNNASDRGVTHQMPAPLNNRFLHIDFEIDAEDWHKRAQKDGVYPLIRSYLRLKPGSLHVFDSAKNPRSFPTPRTWYFVDEIMKTAEYTPTERHELIKGTVGEGAAAEFIGFCRDAAAMPDIDSILMNPTKAKLPGTQAVMHAVVTTLVDDRVTKSNFDRIMEYVMRLPPELQVVFVRGAVNKDDSVCNTTAYMDWGLANKDFIV